MMNPDVKSPWAVSDLEEFRYYNCPLCNVKDPSKNSFVIHALQSHPECKEYIGPLLLKQEIHEGDEEAADDEEIPENDMKNPAGVLNHFISTDPFQDCKVKQVRSIYK